MKTKNLIYFLIILVIFTSCADSVNIEQCVETKPYNFLYGIWHGIILIPSFIFSLFIDDVTIYAVNNVGAWYDFGFLIGVSSSFGSATKASK